MTSCETADCERVAAVVLHIPWREDMVVCPAHARGWATRDGVVPEPLPDHDGEWP